MDIAGAFSKEDGASSSMLGSAIKIVNTGTADSTVVLDSITVSGKRVYDNDNDPLTGDPVGPENWSGPGVDYEHS